jgi:hypothetical protein
MKKERIRRIDTISGGVVINASSGGNSGGVTDHAPVTLGAGSDPLTTLIGQQLTVPSYGAQLTTHAGLTTTAHGLGASAFHADAFFDLAGVGHTEATDHVATHAALITSVHGLVITAGKTVTVTESLTLNALPVGGLAVATAANVLGSLAVGLTTQVLVGGGAATVPAWSADLPTAVTIGAAYVYRAGGTDIAVADGGTNLSSYAVGDLLYASAATTIAKLADVAAGAYLRSGGVTTAPLWSTLLLPNAATAFRLPVATAANTIGELAAVGATGEYLAGATGAIPAWATLNQAAVAGLTTGADVTFASLSAGHLHITADVAAATLTLGADAGLLRKGANILAVAAGDEMQSTTYAAGLAGWRMAADGGAEFQNVRIRGAVQSALFEKSVVSAFAGSLIVAKSAGKISVDFVVDNTAVSFDNTAHLKLTTPTDGAWVLATGDIVRIKAEYSGGVGDTWGTVTRTVTLNEYDVHIEFGTINVTWPAGTAVVDYGPSGGGFFGVSADGTYGATTAWVLATHAGAPWTTFTPQVYAGTDGKLYAGGGNVKLDVNGLSCFLPVAANTFPALRWMSGSTLCAYLDGYYDAAAAGGPFMYAAYDIPVTMGATQTRLFLTAHGNAVASGYASAELASQVLTYGDASVNAYVSDTTQYVTLYALDSGIISNTFTQYPTHGVETGGLHVGGTSDPGDNNLLVDGTLTVTGATTLTTDLTVPNGGTGVSTLALNGILFGNDAAAVGVTAVAGSQYRILTVGASPFVPLFSSYLLDGTAGGKTILAVTNAKVLTITAADTYNLTIQQTLTLAGASGKVLTLTDSLTNEGGNAGILHWDAAATLTIPATGTAALLGTANVFTAAQEIQAASQLRLTTTAGSVYCTVANDANNGLALTFVGTVYQNMQLTATKVNTGTLADGFAAGISEAPTYNAAYTVTRHNYINLSDAGLTGSAVLTDAAVFRFNANTGTHKALASNGAVASVFTANAGPTGAATAIQGWMKINVSGTLRYIPYW